MKLEEAIKYLRQNKTIMRQGSDQKIRFNCESEFFEETFLLQKSDILADDWIVKDIE